MSGLRQAAVRCVGIVLLLCTAGAGAITIGSKKFTENVILAQIAAQVLKHNGVVVHQRHNLGGTRVLWSALIHGDIDLYPEYTGTLTHEILVRQHIHSLPELRRALAKRGVGMTAPLGFNNTYVLGMLATEARRLHIRSISDLRAHPNLRFGFSNEFMDRADGWPGLRQRYHLPQTNVRGMDHDLAYRGLASRSLDVIDLYSTDADIKYYQIQPLRDDLGYFPEYRALYLYRDGLKKRFPTAIAALDALSGSIDGKHMIAMNAAVKIDGKSEAAVAAGFLRKEAGLKTGPIRRSGRLHRFLTNTRDHLVLVGISLGGAILLAIPLGIAAVRLPRTGAVILGITGVLQTIPALALLVFMIPLLGIGGPPAIAALFLYSLLPIVRGTHSGLQNIPGPILESAVALGLPSRSRLRLVELPLAARSILSGIKTSAVINVGTATLGALIGAGGYGQPILTGIRLNDIGLILQGAVPAAVLALLVQGLFDLAERWLLPAGLRYRSIK